MVKSQRDKTFSQRKSIKWQLVMYDAILLFIVSFIILYVYPSSADKLLIKDTLLQIGLLMFSVFGIRLAGGIYNLIWRYGGTQEYIRLIVCDTIPCWSNAGRRIVK